MQEHRDDGHPDGVPVPRPGDDVSGTGAGTGAAEPSGPAIDPRLRAVLERSKDRGLLGRGAVEDHVANARAFGAAIESGGRGWPARLLDLGSGGGVPGLVLAVEREGEVVLLDSAQRRIEVLRAAVADLDLADRVEVVHGRAEDLARDPALRHRFPVVTSRSFGPPAVTAECAAAFLEGPGARLLVSEPPTAEDGRWPVDGLAVLGLRPSTRTSGDSATIQCIEVDGPLDDRFPRRPGVPERRPLF